VDLVSGSNDTSHLSLVLVLSTLIPTFLLGAWAFSHAVRRSRYDAIAFVAIIVYGIVVELIDIRSIENYDYGDLLIMIGTAPDWVPLAVGVSWATIIYIAMRSSDLLGLPWTLRPLYDGAFAVWLDLVMDPVSSSSRWVLTSNHSCGIPSPQLFGGVGLWQWCVPAGTKTLWLSVPLSNFIGWFVVVVAMSYWLRIGREKLRGDERGPLQQSLLIAALAAAAVITVVAFAKLFIARWLGTSAQWTLFALVLLGPLVVVAFYARRLNFRNPLHLALLGMPLMVFVAEPVTFFRRGIDGNIPHSALLFLGSLIGCMVVVLLPYAGRLRGELRTDLRSDWETGLTRDFAVRERE
jgi:hypothetical protein